MSFYYQLKLKQKKRYLTVITLRLKLRDYRVLCDFCLIQREIHDYKPLYNRHSSITVSMI